MKRYGFVFVISLVSLQCLAQWQGGSTVQYFNGNVGIGTSSPGSQLEVKAGAVWNGTIRANTNAAGQYASFAIYENNSLRWGLYNHPGINNTLFFTNSAGQDRMAITQGGNVGIGTITPAAPLEVKAAANFWNGTIRANTENPGQYSSFALFENNALRWSMYNHPGQNNTLFFVNASSQDKVAITQNGYVGIGTATPGSPLEVKAASNFWNGTIRANTESPGQYSSFALFENNALRWSMYNHPGQNNTLLFVNASSQDKVAITQDGNVGIGTITPGSFKLAVNGKIWGQEVQVAVTNPGPDYVFEKDYALPSLESVKTYIDQNKHLPEVPSAKEMEANGINLSEMNLLLLKKVEELTLYVIDLKNKDEILQQLIDNQQKEIEMLKRK